MRIAKILLLLTLITSCSKKKNNLDISKKFNQEKIDLIKNITSNSLDYSNVKTINLAKEKLTILKGSSIIDTCWYIPLETLDNSIFGHIDKILIEGDKIFLLDDRNTGSLFIFNTKGKFINKINKKGRGPNEYIVIRDFTIDSSSKEIILYDDFSLKLSYFDFNGNYIKSEKTSFLFSDLCKFQNSMYYYLGGKDNRHFDFLEKEYLISENKSEIRGYDIPKQEFLNFSLFDQFYRSGKHLSFSIPITKNYIYKIFNESVIPSYKLDFGEKNINQSIIDKLMRNNNTDYYKATKDLNFNMYLGRHLETETKLFLEYSENSESRYALFNKNNNKVIKWKHFIPDDKFTAGILNSQYAIYKDDVFITYIEPTIFTRSLPFLDKLKFKSDRFKQLSKDLKETDNPVLCFIKFKEF